MDVAAFIRSLSYACSTDAAIERLAVACAAEHYSQANAAQRTEPGFFSDAEPLAGDWDALRDLLRVREDREPTNNEFRYFGRAWFAALKDLALAGIAAADDGM